VAVDDSVGEWRVYAIGQGGADERRKIVEIGVVQRRAAQPEQVMRVTDLDQPALARGERFADRVGRRGVTARPAADAQRRLGAAAAEADQRLDETAEAAA